MQLITQYAPGQGTSREQTLQQLSRTLVSWSCTAKNPFFNLFHFFDAIITTESLCRDDFDGKCPLHDDV